MKSNEKRVLFVCTGNAGRSQMADALFAKACGDAVVCSGGVAPWEHLHPVAVRLLQERGFDTSARHPKHVREFADTPTDWVITIGDRALAETPRFKESPTFIHWDIADPADADGTDRQEAVFRQTLAMIEARIPGLCEIVRKGTRFSDLYLEPGISTCVVRPNRFDPAAHLPAFAAAGFKCIELNCFIGSDDFPWDRPNRVRDLQKIVGDTGVKVFSVHASGGIGGYRGASSERLAVDIYKAYADLAADLGAPIVTMHAGLVADESRPLAMEHLRASLDELARHIRGLPCAYAWENRALELSPEEHLRWIRELGPSAFGFVLDTGHSNNDGTTDAYLGTCKGLLCDLHLNDNHGKRDEHIIPGRGTVSWKKILSRLEQNEYKGPMMLEIEARDRQADLAAVLSEARASIEFMKQS